MRYRARLAGLVLAAVSAVTFTVACGSSSDSGDDSKAAGNTDAYTACLQKNGVTLPQMDASNRARPSGGARPSGVRPSGVRPSGMEGGPGGGAMPSGSARPGRGNGQGGFGDQAPQGVDASAWANAVKACASLRPSGAPQGNRRDDGASAAYLNCLSEHGVPASSGTELNTADAKVAEAVKACAPLRPTAAASAS